MFEVYFKYLFIKIWKFYSKPEQNAVPNTITNFFLKFAERKKGFTL